MLALGGRACIALWALVGVVLSDLCTVALGCALRVRSSELQQQALPFLSRLFGAIARQLDFETRRDARRLERQLRSRLRATTASVGVLIERLRGQTASAAAPLPPLAPALRLTVLRRITCNTRSAIAAAGQAGPRLLAALSTAAGRRRKSRAAPTAAAIEPRSSASITQARRRRRAFAAGVDNRLGLGQRWPLALLTGVRPSV